MQNKNDRYYYDEDRGCYRLIENVPKKVSQVASVNIPALTSKTGLASTFTSNVSPSSGNVNTSHSYRDNTGKELSPEQAEYFKDSKVRDEEGNLMAMYHGTPYG